METTLFRSRVKRHQTAYARSRHNLGRRSARTAVIHKHAREPERSSTGLNPVNPAGGCGWLVAGPLVSQLALGISSRERRTIRDRVTGTGVIVDR